MPLIPLRPLLETVDKYHFAQKIVLFDFLRHFFSHGLKYGSIVFHYNNRQLWPVIQKLLFAVTIILMSHLFFHPFSFFPCLRFWLANSLSYPNYTIARCCFQQNAPDFPRFLCLFYANVVLTLLALFRHFSYNIFSY